MSVDAEQITTVARGISDFGFLAIAAGTFVLLSAVQTIAIFVWFRKIINGTLDEQKHTMKALLTETRAQNEVMSEIAEGLRPETLMRIKSTASVYFELSVEKVCHIIKKVRTENHIIDHDATARKVRNLLHNIHEDRNSRFENYTYRGKKLSEYTSPEWVERVAVVVEGELYNEFGEDNGRAHTNVTTVYDNIKLDFYKRLNQ